MRVRGAPRALPTIAALIGAITLLAACSGGGSEPARANGASSRSAAGPIPGASWEKVAPATVGLDPAKLEEIAAVAERGKSNCFLVARDGKLAGEWYFRGTGPDTAQNVFSVTKSVASTLVGIASDDGDLRIGDSASTWIPEWKDTAAEAVTVRDLLSNDSGREWSRVIDYVQLPRAADRTAFAVALPQAEPPGRVWAYNNSAIQTLEPVIQGATGADVTELARRRLFDPLGMADTELATDPAGNAQMWQGLRSTCRDLARFGLLFLNHGRWGDQQIVSRSWVADATGRSSTELNAGYGYLWWLNRKGRLAGPLAATDPLAADDGATPQGQLAPGAPDRMFWALGFGNQVVQVDPDSGTVVVRLGISELRPQPPTFGRVDATRVVTEAVTGPVR